MSSQQQQQQSGVDHLHHHHQQQLQQTSSSSSANTPIPANLPYPASLPPPSAPPVNTTSSSSVSIKRQDTSPRAPPQLATNSPSLPPLAPPSGPSTYSYDPTQSPLQTVHATQVNYQQSYNYASQYAAPPPPPPPPSAGQYASPTTQPYPAVNGGSGPLPSPTPSQVAGSQPQGEAQRRSRLARACDQCSERKVKCDAFGPPCKPCKDLALPCTNNRETKRRGPRNRLAEEYHKAKRLKEDEQQSGSPNPSIPALERRGSAEVSPYMSQNRRHDPLYDTPRSNESSTYGHGYYQPPMNGPYYENGFNVDRMLCPKVILDLLVDDFFMYIHPVAPFPHEPSFRQAYREQKHLTDGHFLSLLASMIGALVASFPRKPQEHLKAKNLQGEFAKSLDFVNRCHKTATDARGPGYLDNNLTIYDGVTSHFLGLAAAYTFEWRRTRLYFSETLGILRTLGVHRAFVPHQGFSASGDPAGSVDHTEIDYIQQQIGRRLFWVMLVGVRSLQQLGATFGELFVPPPTATDPYPPLPEDVDDDYISVNHIETQPRGNVSRLAGFIVNVKIYSALTKIATMEIAYGTEQLYDWPRQKQILNECYEHVERALDYMPIELVLKPGANVGEFASIPAQHRPIVGYKDGRLNGVGMGQFGTGTELSPRRKIQFEIQKANIYASQLGTRSYIVEKFWNLQDAFDKMNPIAASTLSTQGYSDGHTNTYPHAPGLRRKRLEDRVAQERENIVRDLLKVLCSISRVNMEPNGGSFVNKVRQIASTLIVTNDTRKGPLAHQAQEFLGKLLDVLVVLERTGPASPGTVVDTADGGRKQVISEEEELNMWADLREVQMAFLARGGFMAAT